MTKQAITTAATMISISSAMPIAVMIESSENTMSMTMICMITQKNALAFGSVVVLRLARLDLAMNFMGRLRDQEHARRRSG